MKAAVRTLRSLIDTRFLVMMILCVGALGSGKSTLLKVLQLYGQELDSESTVDTTSFIPVTTPTVGTDLLTIIRCDKVKVSKGDLEEKTMVREVGGSMAPIWASFIESGKTKAVLYVVDASSPETIGASTVQLVELLSHPSLESSSVMIVFSKLDLQSARQLHELKNLMRLDQLVANGNHEVTELAFNIAKRDNIADIFNWCMRFQNMPTDNE